MVQLFKKNSWFYIPYILFLLLAGGFLLLFEKREIHLYINNFHCKPADLFFICITHLGDGITIVIFILILLFVKYRYAIILSFSALSTTIAVQAFKRYILPDINRPRLFLFDVKDLYLVPGIEVHTSHSFPSGHSTSAYTIFLLFALITPNKYLKLLLFFLALLIAFSRVYLSQHFLNDIYFGSLIGVILTSMFYVWVCGWNNKTINYSLTTTLIAKKNEPEK